MNLPLSTAFTESHKFGVVVFSFSFVSMHNLISSVIYWLLRSVLFSLHMLYIQLNQYILYIQLNNIYILYIQLNYILYI